MNNWLLSELRSSYYNKQTPIDILIQLSFTNDNFIYHILDFFTVNIFIYLLGILIYVCIYLFSYIILLLL